MVTSDHPSSAIVIGSCTFSSLVQPEYMNTMGMIDYWRLVYMLWCPFIYISFNTSGFSIFSTFFMQSSLFLSSLPSHPG